MTGRVLRINISEQRGVIKDSVESVEVIENFGLKGDGHAGEWDKQVSVFPVEALEKVPKHMKEEVDLGGFTENFTIEGIDLVKLNTGVKLKIGEAEIEVKSIGKETFKEHDRHYIVSREGRFGRVIKSGLVRVGDEVTIICG